MWVKSCLVVVHVYGVIYICLCNCLACELRWAIIIVREYRIGTILFVAMGLCYKLRILDIILSLIIVRDDQSGYTRRTISRRFLTAFIRVSKDNPINTHRYKFIIAIITATTRHITSTAYYTYPPGVASQLTHNVSGTF